MQKLLSEMVKKWQRNLSYFCVNLAKKYSYIDFVMSLTPWGMKTGRDAVIKLLSYIGSPQDKLQVFHVTGSNGKGSVCQMISQVLYKQFGKKVWLFTSPHLIDITERFQINWKPMSHTKLNSYYKKVIGLAQKYTIELSFFEIQVVVMILYFRDEKVDYAVIEVGLGGLYDGTNIFTHPLACFITSITLEHTYVLGKTRTSILKNKLWIVKQWSSLYTHIDNQQVRKYCKTHQADYKKITNFQTHNLTNLSGIHQEKNALLVLQSLTDLWFERSKILKWLQNIYNPGRFEYLRPNILLDTANNLENIKILKKMVQKDFSDATLIFGTTQTDPKYISQLLSLFPNKKKILVDGFCERSLPCSEYQNLIKNDDIWHLDTAKWKERIKKVLEENKNTQKYIIFWSFYLIGYIMSLSRHSVFAKR